MKVPAVMAAERRGILLQSFVCRIWTFALGLLQLYGLVCFMLVLREAIRTNRPLAWLVLLEGVGLMAAGLHDFLAIRIGLMSSQAPELTPHAIFLFVLLQAGLVVARLNQSVADHQRLNEALEGRVAKREHQLKEAFEALRSEREAQAALNERQRIMREIHDGVGSQLVGLLGMVGNPQASRQTLESHVRGALDEMRMAVDSLQLVDGDLTAVLATLRYRLEPRLQAAGIRIRWNMTQLPSLPNLSLQAVLHLQRIVLEAVTNVLKHAEATSLSLDTAVDHTMSSTIVRLTLEDDGKGIATSGSLQSSGHGLANMKIRAAAIGATLSVERSNVGGTAVKLAWPIQ